MHTAEEKLLKIKEIAEKEIDSKDEESLLEQKYKEEITKCKISEKYRCFERPENCSRSLEEFKVPHLVTKNLTFKYLDFNYILHVIFSPL